MHKGISLLLLLIAPASFSATMGPSVPTLLLQEGNVLHVHMPSNTQKSGVPSCASRVYIDLSTEAGKMQASMALSAYMGGKKVKFAIRDGKASCDWGSSIRSDYYMTISD